MLTKLMKYEFRATGKLMLPVLALVLLTAAGARLSVNHLFESSNGYLNTIGVVLVMLFFFACFAAMILCLVGMIERFHKNLLQDEGYLMLTLPVSIHSHIWSKLLVSIVWFIAGGIAAVLALLVMVADISFFSQLGGFLGDLLRAVHLAPDKAAQGTLFLVELAVLFLVFCGMFCLKCYASMAIGYSRPGHKSLWSVGAFIVISIVINTLSGTCLNLIGFASDHFAVDSFFHVSPFAGMQILLLGITIGFAVLGVIYYGITVWFMKHRLNLE